MSPVVQWFPRPTCPRACAQESEKPLQWKPARLQQRAAPLTATRGEEPELSDLRPREANN